LHIRLAQDHCEEKVVPSRHSAALWPREHGAYVQLLAPMLSALAFAPSTPAAFVCAALAIALFLAHEPLVVLLGQRGAKCLAANERAARRHLTIRVLVASLLAFWLALVTPSVALALVLPAALGAGTLISLLQRHEKSLLGELTAAAALTSFSAPVLLAAGVPLRSIGVFMAGWLTVQALATVTARGFVYRRRDQEGLIKAASYAGLLALALSALLVLRSHLSLASCLALAPFVFLALALRLQVYRPRTPKGLGWMLSLANLTAVLLFGLTLPHTP
jgi:hypothetical protein